MSFDWKLFIFTFTSLFLSLYFPFAFLIYTPLAYDINYELNGVYTQIDQKDALKITENLLSYFLYKETLDPQIWSEKELRHMKDVRTIYTTLFFLAVLSFYFFLLFLNKERLRMASKWNLGILILVSSVLYCFDFTYFWDFVFHPLLFSGNLDWLISYTEISSLLFPYGFFELVLVIIALSALALQGLGIVFSFRKKSS